MRISRQELNVHKDATNLDKTKGKLNKAGRFQRSYIYILLLIFSMSEFFVAILRMHIGYILPQHNSS